MENGYIAVLVGDKESEGFFSDMETFKQSRLYQERVAGLAREGFQFPEAIPIDSVTELETLLTSEVLGIDAVLIAGKKHRGCTDEAIGMCNDSYIPTYVYGRNGHANHPTYQSTILYEVMAKMQEDLAEDRSKALTE